MPTTWAMTESDTGLGGETAWRFELQHIPPWTVAPPSSRTDLHSEMLADYEVEFPGRIVGGQAVLTISDELFDRLTEESLLEHGDIWRNLASR